MLVASTVVVFLLISCTYGYTINFHDQEIPDEQWGYVTVREDAHMFWWLYGAHSTERENKPLVLWLQGGPGGSGSGFGNFAELGPLDQNLQERNTTWVQKANVLFIDNPVGSGFSYVTNPNAYTTNVTQIADDLLVIFSNFLKAFPVFTKTPFYIFCESYGGKMTSVFGETLHKAILAQKIDCNFQGVALGDSWISPVDSVLSWGNYLYSYNLLDDKDLDAVNDIAQQTAQAVADGQYKHSTDLWSATETMISEKTDNVNVYNVLQHNAPPFPSKFKSNLEKLYQQHVGIYQQQSLADLMNGPIRAKLGIIPANVTWGAQSADVFTYQSVDFMKPVIDAVDYLIKNNLKVVVFQGQLDMICDTPGAERWIAKLQWPSLDEFQAADRTPLYLDAMQKNTQGFVKTFDNFSLFYIMNAGHMVPADNGPMALQMLDLIIGV